jgi:ABC-type arginine transport system ATPase subunit
MENIALPMHLVGFDKTSIARRSGELLKVVRLLDRQGHLPDELSGGEQQRIAMARALARAVKDKNWIVRVAALRAIAMRGDHESLGTVEAATQDKKDGVRFDAAAAMLRSTGEVK